MRRWGGCFFLVEGSGRAGSGAHHHAAHTDQNLQSCPWDWLCLSWERDVLGGGTEK